MTLHPLQVSFLFNSEGDLSHTPGWENQDWEEVRCRKLPIRIRERHRVLTPLPFFWRREDSSVHMTIFRTYHKSVADFDSLKKITKVGPIAAMTYHK
jgi:hypothetical protein